MPILGYLVWVGTSLLALLLAANWCFPELPGEAAYAAIDMPVIRISSARQAPEPVVIDANQPTIVPPPTPSESTIPDVPSPLRSYASAEPPPVAAGADQKKPTDLKKQRAKVATFQSPAARSRAVANAGQPKAVPPTKLSFLDIVSGVGKRLFNLR
jgi:hypothetical protein